MFCLFLCCSVTSGAGFVAFASAPLLQAIFSGFISAIFATVIYGACVSFIEGRQDTEAIVASLNLFLVVAGSMARGLGAAILGSGITPSAMPGIASLIGFCGCLVMLPLLNAVPQPEEEDRAQRGKRGAMPFSQQKRFFCGYALGIILSIVSYTVVMAIRAFRDYYAKELYTTALGKQPQPSLYVLADLPGAVAVCVIISLLSKIRSNRNAANAMMAIMLVGAFILGSATLLYRTEKISKLSFLITCGIGIYTTYLVSGSAFFDRLLASSGLSGTIVPLQFISDGSGWFGTIGFLLYESFSSRKSADDALKLFAILCTYCSVCMIVCLGTMQLYFWRRLRIPTAEARGSYTRINNMVGDSYESC